LLGDETKLRRKQNHFSTMSVGSDICENLMKSAVAERTETSRQKEGGQQPPQGPVLGVAVALGGDDSSDDDDDDDDGLCALLKLRDPAKQPSCRATKTFGGGSIPHPPKAGVAPYSAGQMDHESNYQMGSHADATSYAERSPQEAADYDVAASAPKVLPHGNDVLMGRGCGSYGHEGNKKFKKLIKEHRPSWKKATEEGRQDAVARRVLRAVGELHPPGRFLARHNHRDLLTSSWYQVEEGRACQKIKEAFRVKVKPASPGLIVEVRHGVHSCAACRLQPSFT
jgi:hypothetical protein